MQDITLASISFDDAYYQGPLPLYGLGFASVDNSCIYFYHHSLYWLVQYAGLTNMAVEITNDGEPLIYGMATGEELMKLAADSGLRDLQRHAWGVSWPFKGQHLGGDDAFASYAIWRESIIRDSQGGFGGTSTIGERQPFLI